MKKFKKDLMSISKSISKIAEKMKEIAETIEKESGPMSTRAKKKAAPKVVKKKVAAKKKESTGAASEAADSGDGSESESLLDRILELVKSSSGGITVAEIKAKTGLAPRQVSNALYKLSKKGMVESVSRGIYVEKKA